MSASGGNAQAMVRREELLQAQEASRRFQAENDKLREELQRRSDLLEKKDGAHAAQVRRLEAAENKIRELVRSESEADYKSRTLSAKIATADKNTEEILQHRKALEKKLQNSQQQVNELSLQLQSQSERLEQLRSVSEQRSQSAGTLEQQNRDLEAKLARAVGKLELYGGKVQTLQRQLSDRETEMVLGQQKAELALKERDVARIETEEARKQAKGYRDSLTELEQTLASHRRQQAETQEALERVKTATTRLERSRQESQDELATLRSELESAQGELALEREQNAVLADQVSQLEAEMLEETALLAAQVEARQEELSELTDQLGSVDRSHNAERGLAQALRKEREALAAELEERTNQLRELKSFAERVKPAYDTLKERYAELQSESKDQQAQLEALRHSLSSTQDASSDLDTLHRDLESRWRQVVAERDELRAAHEQLEQKIQTLEEARDGDHEALEELGEENGRLTDELLEERRSGRELEAQLESAHRELSVLETERARMEARLDEVDSERRFAHDLAQELDLKLQAQALRTEEAEKELDGRRRQLAKLSEDLKHQQSVSAKSQSNIKELLRQRTQLLDYKKHQESLLAAGGEASAAAQERLTLLEADKDALETALAELQIEYDDAVNARDQRLVELEEELRDETAGAADRLARLEARLASDVADRDERLDELETAFEAEVSERDARLLELEAQLGEAISEHAQTMESRETEAADFLERENSLLATIEELQELRRSLEESAEESAAEELRLGGVIRGLETELETLRDRLVSLAADLDEERGASGRLLQELVERKGDNVELHDQCLQMQALVETLESELKARQEESSYQIEQRVKLEESLATLEEAQATLQSKADELSSGLDRSQREGLGLREYIDKLQKVSKARLEQAKTALSAREKEIYRLRDVVTLKATMAATAEAKLERTQMAESALRGALVDLRNMLRGKEEMVEELEWHLGLVYQTLEDGQLELETRDSELTVAREDLQDKNYRLVKSLREEERLSALLASTEALKDRTETELAELQSAHQEAAADLANERRQLAHTTDKLERSSARLERLQSDLVEEQERSARLGAQLTDALEDRNRSVVRLRDLQQEFQDWRDAQMDEGADLTPPQPPAADSGELVGLREGQSRLQSRLEEIRTELSQALERERSAVEERDKLASEVDRLQLEISLSGSVSVTPPVAALGHAELEEKLLHGFDLGGDLVSSQLEFMAAEEAKSLLARQMESAVNLEALNQLVEDLRDADSVLKERQREFEALETEWNEYHLELDSTSQLLLLRFTGLIEFEMREARQAQEKSLSLGIELETSQKRSRERLEALERQLEDKDLLNEELEEELAQLAAQVTELSEHLALAENHSESSEDVVSWKETAALRRELQDKADLLDLYRLERQTAGNASHDSLDEQIELLTERNERGRARIGELLEVIAERDQRLAQLEKEVTGNSIFGGTLLSGSQLVRDLGLSDATPESNEDIRELTAELGRSRQSLREKAEHFGRLQREQQAAVAEIEDKRSEIAGMADEMLNQPEVREKLQLEIDVLTNDLEHREELLVQLANEVEDEAEHRTLEDLPAVPDTRMAELDDGHRNYGES